MARAAADFQPESADPGAEERAKRLQQAVDRAGGPGKVAARSGVNLRTLGYYLNGRDPKSAALVSLADACGVSVEWLAAGRGPMEQKEHSADQVRMPNPVPSKPNWLNEDRMARALAFVEEVVSARDRSSDFTETRVRLMFTAYEFMSKDVGDTLPADWKEQLDPVLFAGLLDSIERGYRAADGQLPPAEMRAKVVISLRLLAAEFSGRPLSDA